MGNDDSVRQGTRYDFAVPMAIELSNGLFRDPDRVEAYLVDLSSGGAGIAVQPDTRIKRKKRYRVWIDGYSGIIEVRNLNPTVEGQYRLGVKFSRLGLELQELVVDSLEAARADRLRLNYER